MKAKGSVPFLSLGLMLTGALLAIPGLAKPEPQKAANAFDPRATILPTPPPTFAFRAVVNSTGDGGDFNPGDGLCETATGNGVCTLRAAIEEANAHTGNNGIRFSIPAGDSGFDSGTGKYTINLGSPLPSLSANMNITGPGADKLTVQRSSSAAKFRIFNVMTTGAVTISGMTIANGFVQNGNGGGILNGGGGTVTITNSALVSNNADAGGGISNESGTASFTNCTLQANSAFGGKGGGGVFSKAGIVSLTNCTIWGNTAISGGGIYNDNTSTLNLISSTISINSVSSLGGGIVQLGAIFNIKSSIVALNIDRLAPDDVFGTFNSQGFNLIGVKDGSTGFTAPTDQSGTVAAPLDPKLFPPGPQDNGGPTETVALLAGSPAINHGSPDSPARDQRGFARQDVPDTGAFEFGGTLPVSLANISTRGLVGTDDNVLIGGFIIAGKAFKSVLLRAIGPSLSNPPINLANTLQDPTLSLFNSSQQRIGLNDNWADAADAASIDPNLRPTNGFESAILTSLAPGAYTAIVSGINEGTGIGLVEVFDLDATVPSKLSNISTRGLVETGDSVLIGGFIVRGPDNEQVVVRAIGPSLAAPPINLTNVLQNPSLGLFNDQGARIQFNDDWQSDQANDITATGLQPSNPAESAIVRTLTPGNYTAIVQGVNDTTGIALVEVYGLN